MKDPDLTSAGTLLSLSTVFMSELGSFLQDLSHDLKNQLGLLGSIPRELSQGFEIDTESLVDAKEVYTKALELSRLLYTGGQFFHSYSKTTENDAELDQEAYFNLLAQLVIEGFSMGSTLVPEIGIDSDTTTPHKLLFLNTQGELIAEYNFYGDCKLAIAKLEKLTSPLANSTLLLELNQRRLLQAVLKLSPIQSIRIEIS